MGRTNRPGVKYRGGHSLNGLLGHIAQACAPNTLVRTFHVTFAGGGAGVQVPGDTCRGEIRAPFEESASDCFEEGGVPRATEGLMCKFNAVGFHADCVGEGCDVGGFASGGQGPRAGGGNLGSGHHRHDKVMLDGRTLVSAEG